MSGQKIAVALDDAKDKFLQIAPEFINYDRERGFAAGILRSNSYLKDAAGGNPASLQEAIINVAAIGLSLNPAEKLAYLIPRSVKEKDRNGRDKYVKRVFLEPSYIGLLRIATDSGSIDWVQACIVYNEDKFTDHGPGNRPTHEYNAFSKDRGEFVGVYCVAKTPKGDYLTNLMTAEEVHSIRGRSEAFKAGFSCPWKSDFNEMAKKACIRQAYKTWPSTNERRMAEAVHLSNENEGFEPILTSPELSTANLDQKEFFDQLITNNDKIGMFLFITSIEESTRTDLYHSFPQGEKGKYRDIVKGLFNAGEGIIGAYIDTIEGCLTSENQDDISIVEIYEETDEETHKFIESKLSNDASALVREVLSNAEEAERAYD